MDSCPVNWEALDFLVLDLARSDNLVEDLPSSPASPSSASSSSSPYRLRLLVRHVRSYLEKGDVDVAIDLLRQNAPAVFNDHRLLFRLQKQKFIELLRKGTSSDRQSAIECLRKALAPCALDAYPEAYEEFKHALLALIYDKEDEKSPVANEWSEKRRLETAGMLSSVLRANLQAYDPVFSMTLRYLLSIHKAYCLRQGIKSPIADLTSRLLCEDRDPPGIPEEILYNAPPFDEVDIQALAHAVGLTRQDAIDSLRFAKGNLHQSFQNELCRMKLDLGVLDEVVREYCFYRGLVNEDETSGNRARSGRLVGGQSASKDCSSLIVDREASVNMMNSREGFYAIDANAPSAHGGEIEFRCVPDAMDYSEACSTSNPNQSISSFRKLKKIRSCGFGQKSRHKRWKGRVEVLEQFPVEHLVLTNKELCESNKSTVDEEEESVVHSSVELPDDKEHKYVIVLQVKELASKGMATEVVDEINALDPDFFLHYPTLLFQLKQVEFLKFVSNGDQAGALRVACYFLGPLASKNPELLKPLKETLFTLLKAKEDAMSKCVPFPTFATSLQVALGERLGIEEPQLMKIVRTTLHSHNEWFRLHMCSDRFERLLKIDCLKNVDSLFCHPTSKSETENCTFGTQFSVSSGNKMVDDGGSPVSVSSDNVLCSENAILKVMEFLALPRADAIHLLMQYNGNAETVIQQMFQ